MNHRGAVCRGDRPEAIGAAVVGDQHLARAAASSEEVTCLVNAVRQSLGLVEARHQNGEFTAFTRAFVPPFRKILVGGNRHNRFWENDSWDDGKIK